ncbi:TPA: hypothetical protein VBA75_002000 [Streptococcus agalactiae]|uniref:hypothetical protein n=1 Tax=Streptococcus agalactiae TaxID=1311 RepID=UPI000332D787|nr:hypothetical protein [Streptococcus agalactiae]QBX20673.1 hypothetical protein Javan53_0014 [Streptococcus phage Javan53]OTG48775.1 hypothetical protein B7934_03220 [Streptococcus agalactiae]OTG53457.1 hypothetical protein B7931_02990 [Streptococcus agalactiae]CCW39582.1 ORF065 [Streptococcus agalactiae ILRI005]HEO6665836.1 hypothetical protein [Streptococcus agalactiae]
MTEVHACLCGKWVNLSEDPACKMGIHMTSPNIWWEENAELYSPIVKDEADTMYQQDYIVIHYQNADYRIHPMFIQIVEK